jgi:hypothetical protein
LKYSQVDKIGKKYNFAKLSEILIWYSLKLNPKPGIYWNRSWKKVFTSTHYYCLYL